MPPEYLKRLSFEFDEIEKQGAINYWIGIIKSEKKFNNNVNGLVLPFLLGVTPIDPIQEHIDHKVVYHADFPDADIDMTPDARPLIRQYAIKKYGTDKVGSVGLWQTYKPKLALQDTARAMKHDVSEIIALTKELPNEFDDMDLEDAVKEYDEFASFVKKNISLVKTAYRIVGKIKTQGRHAGGLIISSVPIKDYIPMMKLDDEWVTSWTEGKNTQLSKFGFVKFDFLGLKTVKYIWEAKRLIKKNRGIDIDLDKIPLDDKAALQLATDLKTGGIFQFETDLAKSIIAKGGVKSFNDLVIYTSLGRPGPLPLVDEYIRRRDDPDQAWRDHTHPDLVRILERTYGIQAFQEQVQQIWVEICGFTYAEAESARKIIAKKWQEKLPDLAKKVISGASQTLGQEQAEELWKTQETFGRYSFNMAHACAYSLIAYRCLYLKAHYPAEWWAAIMSHCDRDRLIRYIGMAKGENVQFSTINCNNLSEGFVASGDQVMPGLNCIKGVGSAAEKLCGCSNYKSVDEFIERNGKGRIVMERLIKLGAFDLLHKNRKAIWMWYLCKCMSDKDARKVIGEAFAWPEQKVNSERSKLIGEFRKLHPKKKVPVKLEKWKPKLDPTIEQISGKIKDFATSEILQFEKQYLGFYWTSPMVQFISKGHTISRAKTTGVLECAIEDIKARKTGSGKDYFRLTISDGTDTVPLVIWEHADDALKVGAGIYIKVVWSDKYRSFTIQPGTTIVPLIQSK